MKRKITYAILVFSLSWSCLDPYEVNVTNYQDLLVVNALITDEVKNHQIHLSRSVPNLDEIPTVESGALVVITDENNNEEVLTEVAPGLYETDKSQFVAKVGGTYTLSIRTSNGKIYKSEPCLILPKSTITNVHYKAGKEWNSDETEELDGLFIQVDGSSYKGGYVRWLYEEDWKFKVPYPTRIDYDYEIEDWVYKKVEKDKCWKHFESNGVIIHSFSNQNNAQIKNKEICFVPSEVTDKLSLRYSILVKQLAISKQEFEFWNKLKIASEDVGNIFGTQPFSIKGNIKNVDDEKEPVLGYFQTGSVSSQRLYIDRKEAAKLGLPIISYNEGCRIDSFKADGESYDSALEIYENMVVNGSYRLYDGIYSENSMAIIGLLLTRPVCNDCTLTGTSQKPDFWED